MIIPAFIFFANLFIGAAFFRRFVYRESFFIAAALFTAVYPAFLFATMMIGIPLSHLTVNCPLLLLPWIIIRRGPAPWSGLRPAAAGRVTALLAVVGCVLAAAAVLHIVQAPLFERDGLGIWLTKAKMIALDRGLSDHNFFDPLRIHDKPRYPLLLPVMEASFMVQTGIGEWTVQLVFAYFWLLILGVLYENLNRRAPRTALPAVIALALVPAYYLLPDGGLRTGYADIPLSLFYLTAIACLARDRPGPADLTGAGLALAGAAFTKNEGWAFGLAALVMLALGRGRIPRLALIAGSALIPLVPWLATVGRLPAVHQEHYAAALPGLLGRLPALPMIAGRAALEMTDARHWGVLWFALPFILIAARPGPALRLPLLILAATLVMYLSVYLLTPWDVAFQMSVSLPRLILHLAPAATYLAALAAGNAAGKA